MTYIKRLVMKGFKSFARETTINLDKNMNCIVGPNGSGKCLTGDSLIQLADGSLERIDNLVNEKLNNAVKTEDGFIIIGDGTEVNCLDMETLKIIKKPIKAFIKKTSPDKLLKIKTRSGKEVTTTKYHPLFVLKDNKVTAAKAEELKQGMRVAIPRKIDFIPNTECFTELIDEINFEDNIYVPYKEEYKLMLNTLKKDLTWEQLAKELGISYYVIKGLLDKQSINFANLIKILKKGELSNIEIINLIDEIIGNGKKTKFSFKNSNEFSRFFGYILAEGRLATSSQIWFTNGNKEIVEDYISLVRKLFRKDPLVREYKPNCWDVIIFSEPLKKILNKLGMSSKTVNKRISNILLKHSSNEEISNLLNGLYCGDGYVSDSSIEITTKSTELANGIINCLNRLGMVGASRRTIKGIKSSGFIGEYTNVILYGVNNFKKFSENINLVHLDKKKRINDNLYKKSNSNIDLIPINSLVKDIVFEQNINVKKMKIIFPRIDSYVYNQCLPTREGLLLLRDKLLIGNSDSTNILDTIINSDIFWDEISEIEEINGVDWVYDLSVEKDHNFIANNMFVHNSNITDGICFVLGRLGIKSMRAAKASNLIFTGNKHFKGSNEAFVEIVFDNSNKTFSLEENEIAIKRVLRKNGQSIYKINNQTKTRQEVLELLSQAGIDPYGFNIILQGEIQKFVKMNSEERRKVIEEVSGISVYEMRKEKSLRELEKTNEKLRQINAVLRERTNYLKNLENEREQALKYKNLEILIKRCKASLINRKINETDKELKENSLKIDNKNKEIEKKDSIITKIKLEIDSLNNHIDTISKSIQKTSGFEQDSLMNEISELKQEVAGSSVRKGHLENQLLELDRRIDSLKKTIDSTEKEIEEMINEKGKNKKQALEQKQKKLEDLDEVKRSYYLLKSKLSSLEEQIEYNKRQIPLIKNESNFVLSQIEDLEREIKDIKNINENDNILLKLKELIEQNKSNIAKIENDLIEGVKSFAVSQQIIKESEKIKTHILKIDICPLCQTKMTKEHVKHGSDDANNHIKKAEKDMELIEKEIKDLKEKLENLKETVSNQFSEMQLRKIAIIKIQNIKERKSQISRNNDKIGIIEKEIKELEARKKGFDNKLSLTKTSEEDYEKLRLEVNELQRSEERNLGIEITARQRELEKTKLAIKQALRDKEEIKEQLQETISDLEEKESLIEEKEEQSEEQRKKYHKMYEEKNKMQDRARLLETNMLKEQNEKRFVENDINNFKIVRAQIQTKKDTYLQEFEEFKDVEILNLPIDALQSKLQNSELQISKIGTVNMKALEVYDHIKAEYDKVREKVTLLENEEKEILRVIEQIDRKKKKTFIHMLEQVNNLFSTNFSQLSSKGIVHLEVQDEKDIFAKGLDIKVRVEGKRDFDVTSLSGGEQTLVALSLIFAIQELKPYSFYIFDEIDAALDRRNSEKLAYLLKKNIKEGQYVIITHNDSIISESSNLIYGVSMQEGISKVLSLEV